jgi:hypothetical protein
MARVRRDVSIALDTPADKLAVRNEAGVSETGCRARPEPENPQVEG